MSDSIVFADSPDHYGAKMDITCTITFFVVEWVFFQTFSIESCMDRMRQEFSEI